jgi:hypothetical protein
MAILPAAARAANQPPLQALYQITLDIDHDGKLDRAALVAPVGTGFYSADKAWLMLGPNERADLYIYLGRGNERLDLSRKPSFLKKDLIVGERNNQIFALESRKGSLIVKTAFNLHSNWAPETLTIAYRRGEFLVAGYSYSFEMKSGDQGSCDINFLTGKGVASRGGAKAKPIKARFRPIKLADWSNAKRPKGCDRGARLRKPALTPSPRPMSALAARCRRSRRSSACADA